MSSQLYELLQQDVRFLDGLHACINCGTCTAICPAAEFYNYDPRLITTIVQTKDNEKIEELLKSDTIWYCGECLSCKTRCPRNNTPGYIILALRYLSLKLGYFTESEKGRQTLALKRIIGDEILRTGYCMYVDRIFSEMHPEQGPVWAWVHNNPKDVFARFDGNYQGDGPGILRKIPDESLSELKRIFDITGCTEFYEHIESKSKSKAGDMGLQFDGTHGCDYFKHIYTTNNKLHNNKKIKKDGDNN